MITHRPLDRHLHGNRLVGVITLDDKILDLPPVDAASLLPPDLQLWKVSRLPLQLRPERLYVVCVDMRVAHDVCEAPRHEIAHVREHVRQQCVAGDVERNAEAHVARALVQLAVQVTLGLLVLTRRRRPRVRHVELRKHVARRQRHDLEVLGVPRAHDDAPVVGVRPQLVHHVGQLVDALTRVVRARVDVLGAKVPPLEPVHGAQVAHGAVGQAHAVQELARAVAVPDFDPLLAER